MRKRSGLQGFDVNRLDYDVFQWLVTAIGCHSVQCVNNLAGISVNNFTEDGVLALQPGGWNGGDEELRTVGAAAHADTRVSHSQLVRLVEVQLWVDLIIELVARATEALTQWVTTLNHEVSDDAVEDGACVQGSVGLLFTGLRVYPLLLTGGQANEVLYGLRCVVAEELDNDVAQRSMNRSFMRCNSGHGFILSCIGPWG